MSEQKSIVRNQKSVQEVSKHHGKTDVRYWQSKLFKPWYTKDGEKRELDQYAIKIQHKGWRETFNLGTPNGAAAAAKARDIYVHLTANGWDDTVARCKPKSQIAIKTHATVGDFLSELKAKAELDPKTLEGYEIAFRKILTDAFEIDGGKERFDYQKGGRERWLEKIHAIKLADVTPVRIQTWKRAFLAKAGSDKREKRSASISVNSFLRRAERPVFVSRPQHRKAGQAPPPPSLSRIHIQP